MTMPFSRDFALALLLAASAPSALGAQGALRISSGDRIRVRLDERRAVTGTLVSQDSVRLVLTPPAGRENLSFALGTGTRVETVMGTRHNFGGAKWGAIAGGVVGAVAGPAGTAAIGAVGAVLGGPVLGMARRTDKWVPVVVPGSRLRTIPPDVTGPPRIGTVVAVRSDALLLRADGDAAPFGIDRRRPGFIEMHNGTRYHTKLGAAIGLAAGLAIGLHRSSSACDDDCINRSIVAGAGLTVLGALTGHTFQSEHWVRITPGVR